MLEELEGEEWDPDVAEAVLLFRSIEGVGARVNSDVLSSSRSPLSKPVSFIVVPRVLDETVGLLDETVGLMDNPGVIVGETVGCLADFELPLAENPGLILAYLLDLLE